MTEQDGKGNGLDERHKKESVLCLKKQRTLWFLRKWKVKPHFKSEEKSGAGVRLPFRVASIRGFSPVGGVPAVD